MGLNKIVDFTTAKLLKEKGFDIPCKMRYEYALTSRIDPETNSFTGSFGWEKGECDLHSEYFINNHVDIDTSDKSWYLCSAPTIIGVVMWLYEKHSIWIVVNIDIQDRWYFELFNLKAKRNAEVLVDVEFWFNSPTEAYSKAIGYILNNLI